jgi:hypothetical protein
MTGEGVAGSRVAPNQSPDERDALIRAAISGPAADGGDLRGGCSVLACWGGTKTGTCGCSAISTAAKAAVDCNAKTDAETGVVSPLRKSVRSGYLMLRGRRGTLIRAAPNASIR